MRLESEAQVIRCGPYPQMGWAGNQSRELAGSAGHRGRGRLWRAVGQQAVLVTLPPSSQDISGHGCCWQEHSCVSLRQITVVFNKAGMVRVFMILINKKSGRKTAPGLVNLFNSVIKDPDSFDLTVLSLSGSPWSQSGCVVKLHTDSHVQRQKAGVGVTFLLSLLSLLLKEFLKNVPRSLWLSSFVSLHCFACSS